MNTRHSYEDFQWVEAPEMQLLPESFSGTSIVRWYNTMKFKLRDMIRKQEANRNQEYADLLRTYANTWDKNAITGSINRETLELLKAASEPYAKMDWNQQSFFVGLCTSLDELIADQEALPTGVDTEQNMPGAGGGGSMPPMGGDFGPEENPPPGMGGPEGDMPPGGEGGAMPQGGEGFPKPPEGEEQPPPGEPGQPGQPGPGEEDPNKPKGPQVKANPPF